LAGPILSGHGLNRKSLQSPFDTRNKIPPTRETYFCGGASLILMMVGPPRGLDHSRNQPGRATTKENTLFKNFVFITGPIRHSALFLGELRNLRPSVPELLDPDRLLHRAVPVSRRTKECAREIRLLRYIAQRGEAKNFLRRPPPKFGGDPYLIFLHLYRRCQPPPGGAANAFRLLHAALPRFIIEPPKRALGQTVFSLTYCTIYRAYAYVVHLNSFPLAEATFLCREHKSFISV